MPRIRPTKPRPRPSKPSTKPRPKHKHNPKQPSFKRELVHSVLSGAAFGAGADLTNRAFDALFDLFKSSGGDTSSFPEEKVKKMTDQQKKDFIDYFSKTLNDDQKEGLIDDIANEPSE